MTQFVVRPIGRVESSLLDRSMAPRQGDEGAPEAWVVLRPEVQEGVRGLAVGDELVLLTWFHRADRETLVVHPRGEVERPLQGVFTTRAPDRPNPIGLHRVTVLAIEGNRLRVNNLEAIDGTPIVDVKPVLGRIEER